ncbi:unnamed protein product, partial [Laminaria digitata]
MAETWPWLACPSDHAKTPTTLSVNVRSLYSCCGRTQRSLHFRTRVMPGVGVKTLVLAGHLPCCGFAIIGSTPIGPPVRCQYLRKLPPRVAFPVENICFRRFFEQVHNWKHLYLCIFFVYTTFRNSAITPATPSIPNFTTLRWGLWCSHYSVAKR